MVWLWFWSIWWILDDGLVSCNDGCYDVIMCLIWMIIVSE